MAVAVISLLPDAISATGLVTITVVPFLGSGILTFTVTQISDTEVDLAWTKDAGITNVMVRAKYGTMPMSRTEGYLVYEGALDSAVDTSMDFNETAGTLYYRIWGQRADGLWLDYEVNKASAGGLVVTLLAIGVLVATLSYIAIRSNFILLKIAAMGVWFFLFMYIKDNPPAPLVAGSAAHQVLIVVCIAVGIGMGLSSFGRNVNRNSQSRGISSSDFKWKFGKDKQEYEGSNLNHRETIDEYQLRVRRALGRDK